MKNLINNLNKIGISQGQFEVYKCLLEYGPSTVLELSGRLKFPRTTIHQNVEKLISLSLVNENIVGKKRKLTAAKPERINQIIKAREAEIQSKQKELVNLSETITPLVDWLNNIEPLKKLPDTQVMFFEGIDKVKEFYSDVLKSPKVKTYADGYEIARILPDCFEKFINAAKNGVEIWDIDVRSSESYTFSDYVKDIDNYHCKFFPENISFNAMDYIIYRDCIATVQGGSNPSVLIIKNPLMAKNAEMVYDLLWKLL